MKVQRVIRRAATSSAVIGLLVGITIAVGLRFNVLQGATANGQAVYEGELETSHSDDFAHGHATFKYKLKTATGVFDLEFGDHHPAVPAAKKIKVKGQKDGTIIRVPAGTKAEAADGSGGAATTQAVAAVSGPKRVAVILIKTGTQSEPYPASTAQGVAFTNANSVAAYFAEASKGQLTISGDVFGWYNVAMNTTACNESDWLSWSTAADNAAANAGVNLSSYDYKVYAFPQVGTCGWAGLAYLPGTRSYLNGVGGMSLRVMSHELGHNLGTHHASTIACTENGVAVAIPTNLANCNWSEYGDPYTVMGSASSRHTTNFSMGNFGWMSAANTQDITTNGVYTITAAEDPSTTAVKALRIARPSGDFLLLELRKPFGQYFDNFPATDAAVTGVSIRIVDGYSVRSQSRLVDTTPGSGGNAPLALNAVVRDPVRGVTLKTTAVGPGSATVEVNFDPDTQPPTAPGSLRVASATATQVQLAWNASTDNVGVASYEVRRDGNVVGNVTGLAFIDNAVSPGVTYAYTVRAVDAAGNAGPSASASATTPVPDTQAPSAPGTLTATAQSKPSRVSLSWGASTDNVAVTGYVVYRNGVQVATTTSRTFTDRPGRGTFTYTVKARDAAGNLSAASTSATVTVK